LAHSSENTSLAEVLCNDNAPSRTVNPTFGKPFS
jgi:hypothetical protein